MITYNYSIAEHFMAALINGDDSGLTDEEINALNSFEESLPKHYHLKAPMHGNWDIIDTEPSFAVCEVCEGYASCLTVQLHFI
jgi:hypothetical protein